MTDTTQESLTETTTFGLRQGGQPKPTLQRGGEALVLEKMGDRFTLCAPNCSLEMVLQLLKDGAATAGWTVDATTLTAQLMPTLALVEIQAPADRLDALMQAARSSEKIAYASHIYQMQRSPGTLLYLTDQITLQFADVVASEQMHQITVALGLQVLKLVAGVPRAFVFQLTRATGVNPLKLAHQLSQHAEILVAEPNVAVLRQPFYRPRESEYRQQWYLQTEGGENIAAGAHIFAEPAWNLTRGNRSVVVAVVDDGVDLTHPDFQSEGKIVAPLDLQENGLPLPKPGHSHGTDIARLATADETGKGIIGVAPGCALMPIRIGELIDDQIVERWCEWVTEKGADVVCCGWGAAAVYFPLSLRQRAALSQAALQGREGRGCVLIFAAGNANRPIDGVVDEQGWNDQFLNGKTRWLNGFAVHPDVITVAACTSLNHKSASSNWGMGLSVAAPGGHATPTLYTQQTGVLATAPVWSTPQPGQPVYLGQPIQATDADVSEAAPRLGDTSAACALVAGVAALILSVNPDLRAQEVRQILEQTADRVMDREVDQQLGLCLGSYDASRYSAWFGYGKVNAVKAVQLAQAQYSPLPLPSRWISYLSSQPVEIPDANPQGAISRLEVTETSFIRDLEISVEVEHEFLGDLEIYLLPPWGKPMLLQSRGLGRLTSLKTTYSPENTLWLKAALNRSAKGEWQLQLIDRIPTCSGRLLKWQLNLGL
jgi:subtilisin family serine protease